jgi:hypothetical protein
MALVVAIATACSPAPTGPPTPPTPIAVGSQSPAASGGASANGPVALSPDAPAVDPAMGRLVWLVDRAGGPGIWTTDLAGGDVRPYVTAFDEAGTSIRDARPIGEEVALLRDVPAPAGAELWIISQTAPPRLVLDSVQLFTVLGGTDILAVRDQGTTRSIWSVTGSEPPTSLASLALPDDDPELGPFGFTISPHWLTVAAGWVGGPLEVIGPTPASYNDRGAPLVVADDGRLVAVTGRAGEAYLVDGDRLVELAPADSDPLAPPGTGWVAWPSVAEDGGLVAVEVRDLLAGTSETYPASGLATNIRELTANHVILEATAFDPLRRTVTVVDRRDGRTATFEATAPPAD